MKKGEEQRFSAAEEENLETDKDLFHLEPSCCTAVQITPNPDKPPTPSPVSDLRLQPVTCYLSCVQVPVQTQRHSVTPLCSV